ncbi:AtpZ/AtpI family protein [Clostridium sp. D2Q-14]|uniref:AtpZ/AtpI family protein n=1 Tax=Anaeromonas gelatinilytica TaxID=2683194 RepID=UPI00193B5072|nr:AtpZ/AtpI family protein [Anaeromonas gelatinilytica]MBS4536447.1 AtpZ/AtpI family protein [Anaeromonas gelatinilytica]
MSPKDNNDNKRKTLQYLAYISQIGISMIVPIMIGIFLGKFLDDSFGTKVLFLAIFSVIGVAAAFVNLFKMTTRDINRK